MELTRNEAIVRVKAIWNLDVTLGAVALQPDDLNKGSWLVKTGVNTHRLDADGHPDCHAHCNDLEAASGKKARPAKSKAVNETAQRAADAYIELAQFLEKLAAAYKDRAKHYRSGALLVGYTDLPSDAGAHMRHPAQRAIDAMSEYDVKATYERIRAELTTATAGGAK